MSILLIAPQDQQAWLVGPSHEAARDGVPLCASHADRVTVPFGWQLRDARPTVKPRTRRKSRARKPEPQPAPESAAPTTEPAGPTTEPAAPTTESAAEPAVAQRGSAVSESSAPGPAAVESAEPAPVDPAARETTEHDQAETTAGPAEETPVGSAASVRDADPGVDTGPAAPSRAEDRRSPAEVPVHAEDVAAAMAGSGARLSVVPGDDDPSKTFTVEADGQTALWAERPREDHEPTDETPLLKRAFRVVRED